MSDQFLHVRVLIGIVLGLGLTHLLAGLAGLIQHPGQRRGREKLYWVHLGWVFSILLGLIHFWWWQFQLRNVATWNFELYAFVTFYVTLYYLLCALLFPKRLDDYDGYEDYFLSRRAWFFGILALIYALDFVDTWIKGAGYFASLGIEYPLRNAVYIVLCLAAAAWRDKRFQAVFLVVNLIYQVSWIVRLYSNLG
ncbi:MAG TPA: hypothetical protein VM639_15915 [Dongiaceae bacterium]|nr:hypothetical protein [Dongiaceae bacterium]